MLDLVFDYQHDWRLHVYLFRTAKGKERTSARIRNLIIGHALWILFFMYVIYVAARCRQVPLLLITAVALVSKLPALFGILSHMRYSLFFARSSFRRRPIKQLRLIVTEDGLVDHDSGVESYAPWSAIKSFSFSHDVVAIDLVNSTCALIPKATLSPASPPIEELLKVLREKGIAERQL